MIRNKTILVANATSSVGDAVIQKAQSQQAHIIACTRRKNFSNLKPNTQAFDCLHNEDSIRNFIQNTCPILDGVVISIGSVDLRPLSSLSASYFNNEVEAHLTIPILIISNLIKYKKLRKGVSIVFISSINGTLVTSTGSCVYGLLKSAIVGFSKGLAKEIGQIQGRSNCICPGIIDNSQLRSNYPEDLIQEMQDASLTRKLTSLEEVAETVIFLLSDKAKNITGTNIVIDGGYSAL